MVVSDQLHAPAALPQGKNHLNHWVEDWLSPRADMDAVAKKKSPSFPRREIMGFFLVKPVA
jgi:hypothetical protein